MLNVNKDIPTNVSLDVLSLIESVAADVIKMVDASFYSNGVLFESGSIKNLHGIKGRMAVLIGIVEHTKK